MEKAILKANLHRLIDAEEDEIMLENILVALHGYQPNSTKDILDDLSEKQLADLREAQEQVHNGQFITNEAMKAKTKSWFTK